MKLLHLLLLLSLTSCVNDAYIGRKVKKIGAERTLGYLQSHHSELFTQRVDTLRDTVTINTLRVDTAFTLVTLRTTDTITITKDRLKTKIWFKHDSIFVNSECKGDTIYVEKVVKTTVPSKDYSRYDARWIIWLLLLILALFLISKYLDTKKPS